MARALVAVWEVAATAYGATDPLIPWLPILLGLLVIPVCVFYHARGSDHGPKGEVGVELTVTGGGKDGEEGAGGDKGRFSGREGSPACGACTQSPPAAATADGPPPEEAIDSSDGDPSWLGSSAGRWDTEPPLPGRQNSDGDEEPSRLCGMVAAPTSIGSCVHQPTSGHSGGERINSFTGNNSTGGPWDTEPRLLRRPNRNQRKHLTDVAPPKDAGTHHPWPTSRHEGGAQPSPDNSNISPSQLETPSRRGVVTESTSPGRQNSNENEKPYRRITDAAPTIGGGLVAAALGFLFNVPRATRAVILYAYYFFAMTELAVGCSIMVLHLAMDPTDSVAVVQAVLIAAGLMASLLDAFFLVLMAPMAHAYLSLVGALVFSASLITGSIYYANRIAGGNAGDHVGGHPDDDTLNGGQ